MEWINIKSEDGLKKAVEESKNETVLLFKHSTRCSVSSMALNRLERGWDQSSNIRTYFLDLISYRAISNKIENDFGIEHQSPQAIVLKDGKPIYNSSHMNITAANILSFA